MDCDAPQVQVLLLTAVHSRTKRVPTCHIMFPNWFCDTIRERCCVYEHKLFLVSINKAPINSLRYMISSLSSKQLIREVCRVTLSIFIETWHRAFVFPHQTAINCSAGPSLVRLFIYSSGAARHHCPEAFRAENKTESNRRTRLPPHLLRWRTPLLRVFFLNIQSVAIFFCQNTDLNSF